MKEIKNFTIEVLKLKGVLNQRFSVRLEVSEEADTKVFIENRFDATEFFSKAQNDEINLNFKQEFLLGKISRTKSGWSVEVNKNITRNNEEIKASDETATRNDALKFLITKFENFCQREAQRGELKRFYKDASEFAHFEKALDFCIKYEADDCHKEIAEFQKRLAEMNPADIIDALVWRAESTLVASNLLRHIANFRNSILIFTRQIDDPAPERTADDTQLISETATFEEYVLKVKEIASELRETHVSTLINSEPWRHSSSSAMSNVNKLAESTALSKMIKVLQMIENTCNSFLLLK